jgi:hypothetical protein
MLWTALVVIAAIAFFKFPVFRKAILIVVCALVLIVLVYFAKDKHDTEVSKELVRVDQLAFMDMTLGPETYGSSYKLIGRVKNNSPYAVYDIKARIRVLDCNSQSHCDVVGEENTRIGPFLPPGQVRDINDSVFFDSGTRVRGQFQWNYEITEVSARVP